MIMNNIPLLETMCIECNDILILKMP